MYGSEQGLTYRVWLTPVEVVSLASAEVRGTLEQAGDRRPLVVRVLEAGSQEGRVVVEPRQGPVTIRLSPEHYQDLCTRGLVSLVTGNLELIHAYDVSRCASPDATLRQLS